MFLELLPRELKMMHKNDVIQLYEITTAAGSPDIRALGHCAQLKSARSGHCLAHFGTARQCYTCSKHFSCVGNALLITVWCWVDENLIITSLAFAVDYFFFLRILMVPFFSVVWKDTKFPASCATTVLKWLVNDRCCVPHLPSSPSLWRVSSILARLVDT